MKHMVRVLSLVVVMLSVMSVHAIQISQVVFAPTGTDSGGEAVELFNDGDEPVDIGGWSVRTESSAKDATVPVGEVLYPGNRYLIADIGWSDFAQSRGWRDANHEEVMTMSNSDSGVAIVDSAGVIVDAVGWGDSANIDEGLFEGMPANESAGMLVRVNDFGNNSRDFLPVFAALGAGLPVVLESAPLQSQITSVVIDDDLDVEGVQVLPSPGIVRSVGIRATVLGGTPTVHFMDSVLDMAFVNGTWFAELMVDSSTVPDQYPVSVVVGDVVHEVSIEVLPIKAVQVDDAIVRLSGQGASLTVKNAGNVLGSVSVSASNFTDGVVSIAPNAIQFSPDGLHFFEVAEQAQQAGFDLMPGAVGEMHLRVSPHLNVQGVFTGSLKVRFE